MIFKIHTNSLGEQIIVGVSEDSSICWIPMHESNIDYQAYLMWLEVGNTPEEWNPGE